MKEVRFFFCPEASAQCELPKEEAQHAVRVLRLSEGDEIHLMDGRGTFYRAEITAASNHRCAYRIVEEEKQTPAWTGHLHLAMAPTKLNDRVEWFAEKATEIGFDELSFLNCQFSERRVIKSERIDKILVSATKQSHKAWKPVLNEMTDFAKFVQQERSGQKFICHCYDEADVCPEGCKPFLMDVLEAGDATILIGPEGDFSVDEVKLALHHGYRSVSLGRSRLRTETAALAAVHMMQIKNQR
ncbi:MAG: 16S rRNA (uracil(1498)-N(3))-methyltransferase [Bacteroidaceae bacterium]|nr:16S rRNA (uracil(1498)-N(3))-methyltransferase [Bacteroidaceae bacterium]